MNICLGRSALSTQIITLLAIFRLLSLVPQNSSGLPKFLCLIIFIYQLSGPDTRSALLCSLFSLGCALPLTSTSCSVCSDMFRHTCKFLCLSMKPAELSPPYLHYVRLTASKSSHGTINSLLQSGAVFPEQRL